MEHLLEALEKKVKLDTGVQMVGLVSRLGDWEDELCREIVTLAEEEMQFEFPLSWCSQLSQLDYSGATISVEVGRLPEACVRLHGLRFYATASLNGSKISVSLPLSDIERRLLRISALKKVVESLHNKLNKKEPNGNLDQTRAHC